MRIRASLTLLAKNAKCLIIFTFFNSACFSNNSKVLSLFHRCLFSRFFATYPKSVIIFYSQFITDIEIIMEIVIVLVYDS